MCLFVFPADDKGGMGGPAEERTRRERAEAAGETRQRGETWPRRIETKKEIYPLLPNHEYFYNSFKWEDKYIRAECFFCKMSLFCTWFSLTEWHKQPSNSLTKDTHKEKNPSALTSRMYLLHYVKRVCENVPRKFWKIHTPVLVNVVLTLGNRYAAVCWPLHIFTSRVFTPFVGGRSENVGWSWKPGINTHECHVTQLTLTSSQSI